MIVEYLLDNGSMNYLFIRTYLVVLLILCSDDDRTFIISKDRGAHKTTNRPTNIFSGQPIESHTNGEKMVKLTF